jgi:sensor histidine kinase YesM
MEKLIFDNSFKFRLARHVLFFLSTVLVFVFILYMQNGAESFAQILWTVSVNGVLFFCYAYITIFLLIPELLLARKVGWFILLFLLVGIALSAVKLMVSDQMFYASISPENMDSRGAFNLRSIVVNTKDMTFVVALFCIGKYVKDFIYAEKTRKLLAIETKEAQRKLIQSQFDPHFLFNTINNLYAISLLNPAKTIEVIGRIKIVLKYIIDEIQKGNVGLESEINLAKNYIQLEKLRYGDRLKVDLCVTGMLEGHKIPPLILFFLIENAFKYGSSLDAGTPWINAEISAERERITLFVENSKPLNPVSADPTENQLKNLRKRLDIMYKANGYELKINETENLYSVKIILKQQIENREVTFQ